MTWKESIKKRLKEEGFTNKTIIRCIRYIELFISSGLSLRRFLIRLSIKGKAARTIAIVAFAIELYLSLSGDTGHLQASKT